MLLDLVLPIIVVAVLIIALLLARKYSLCRSNNTEKLRPWPGQQLRIVENLTTKKPEPTFVAAHRDAVRMAEAHDSSAACLAI